MTQIGRIKPNNNGLSHIKNRKTSNIQFKGSFSTNASKLLSNTMERFERGDFLAELLIVDFCGLLVPRTIQGFFRNRDKIGHLNYKAGIEEFLREMLAAPVMVALPAAIAWGFKKKAGSSVKIPVEKMTALKDYHHKAIKTAANANNLTHDGIRQHFIKTILDDALPEQNLLPDIDRNAKIDEIHNQITDFIKKPAKEKKSIKKLNEAIQSSVKELKEIAGLRENLEAVEIKGVNKPIKVSTLINHIKDYTNDTGKHVSNFIKNEAKDGILDKAMNFLDDIHITKVGYRKSLALIATGALSLFLFITPSIYQRYKKYPGLEGLVDDNENNNKLAFQSKIATNNSGDYFKMINNGRNN